MPSHDSMPSSRLPRSGGSSRRNSTPQADVARSAVSTPVPGTGQRHASIRVSHVPCVRAGRSGRSASGVPCSSAWPASSGSRSSSQHSRSSTAAGEAVVLPASERVGRIQAQSGRRIEQQPVQRVGVIDVLARQVGVERRVEVPREGRRCWSAPASLEAPKLADLPIEYHPQALYSRLPRTFSEAYPRRMSGSDHRYTTEPSQP